MEMAHLFAAVSQTNMAETVELFAGVGSDLFHVNPQDDVHLFAVIELAYRLRVALLALVLRVDLVVDVRRKFRKADDPSTPTMYSSPHGCAYWSGRRWPRQGIVAFVEHFTRQ